MIRTIYLIVITSSLISCGLSIKCFQCSSHEDPKGVDNCGAYEKFDEEKHVSVDCSSGEAVTPGTFCMKIVKQSPIGFIWDGRWRQVIRRCASVADTGVTGVCNWGVDLNGDYWEECYCSDDECNTGSTSTVSGLILLTSFILGYLVR